MTGVASQQCTEADCGHNYSEHDLFGCQKYLCKCKRIDRNRRFDPELMRDVEDPAP